MVGGQEIELWPRGSPRSCSSSLVVARLMDTFSLMQKWSPLSFSAAAPLSWSQGRPALPHWGWEPESRNRLSYEGLSLLPPSHRCSRDGASHCRDCGVAALTTLLPSVTLGEVDLFPGESVTSGFEVLISAPTEEGTGARLPFTRPK